PVICGAGSTTYRRRTRPSRWPAPDRPAREPVPWPPVRTTEPRRWPPCRGRRSIPSPSCTGLGGGIWTGMSGTSTKSGTCCGGGTGSPQPRSSPCCRSDRPRCRPDRLGCPAPPALGWWGLGGHQGPPHYLPAKEPDMGRHEENTVVSGIVNYGGTYTSKNAVGNGKRIDDKSLSTPKKDDKNTKKKWRLPAH